MHNTKRVISMMLVLCMLMSVLPIGAFAAENTDGTANGDAQTVSLTVGESKSFTDNSGDYSEMDTSGLNTSVATVSMSGSSENVTYGVLKDSTNNGTKVALSDSEYTFTGAASAYEITIDKDGSTWYIKGSSGGHSTTKVTNTITWMKTETRLFRPWQRIRLPDTRRL